MKNLKYFLIIQILLIPLVSSAQYKLQPAFPNLAVAFSNPIELVHADDGTNRLFAVQQRGIIYVFNNSPTVSTRKIFINLSSKVSQSGSETGLLGLAFHPDYENNRYFYVNYTFDSAAPQLWSRISRFTASSSNPDTVLINTELILMTLNQPFSNHNGGKVAFGPDGYLYISFGDGGSGGDPFGNGQNKSTLLGKILRIDINNGSPYSIPPTNPFYGNTKGWKEEIYCYGMRNPWKFSFDVPTNRLWAGDVGQDLYEEIDLIENGENYGWNKMEGFHCYPPPPTLCDTTGMNFTRPIWEYSHGVGQSVTGGYVYRGALLPDLYGKYIYADYIAGTIWALTYDGINPPTNVQLFDTNFNISSFGVDQNNELYVCRYSASNGIIYKLYNTSVITLNLKAVIEGFYDILNNRLNIKDTIRVYLHLTTSPNTIVDSAKTVIDSLTFSGLCFFNNAPTSKYYIVLKHRNALETWSRIGGDSLKRGSVISYDFTTDSTKAFGNNLVKKGNIYCLYSGNVNQDNIIDISDLSPVYNEAKNIDMTFYNTEDLNSDGIVDISDISIAYDNLGRLVINP